MKITAIKSFIIAALVIILLYALGLFLPIILKSKPQSNFKINPTLIIFYLVIRFSVGKKKEIEESKHLTTYLGGVRILILILAAVGLILWFFI